MNSETHSWAAVRSPFEPPRSSYLESNCFDQLRVAKHGNYLPAVRRFRKRCAFFMRPNYTRGCDKDSHTPLFLNDPRVLVRSFDLGHPGRVIRQKNTGKKNPALSKVCQRLSYPV